MNETEMVSRNPKYKFQLDSGERKIIDDQIEIGEYKEKCHYTN